jgi:hypothetical protein
MKRHNLTIRKPKAITINTKKNEKV